MRFKCQTLIVCLPNAERPLPTSVCAQQQMQLTHQDVQSPPLQQPTGLSRPSHAQGTQEPALNGSGNQHKGWWEFVIWNMNRDCEEPSPWRGAHTPDGEGLVTSADTMGFQLAPVEKRR